jgi:penicillin amidase
MATMNHGRSAKMEGGSAAVRVVAGLLVAMLIAVVAAFGCAWWLLHTMRASLPQLDGTIRLSGLTAPVAVRRDEHGVPHIAAANLDDLLFAQGYVTAQDRLWQLDMERRMTAGTAAEILGSKLLVHDRIQRVLALRATAERMTAELNDQDRRCLADYARGVNAYIQSHQDRLPAEFRLLMYRPQPWTPADSMTVALGMVQMLDEHWPEKIERERITERLGPTLAADLYPSTTSRDHPVISSQPPIAAPSQATPAVPLATGALSSEHWVQEAKGGVAQQAPTERGNRNAFPLMARLTARWLSPRQGDAWAQVMESSAADCLGCNSGSNEWVVSGAKSASGHAILSNDMHLQHQIPDIWYEVDLQAPGFHAAGLSVPGLPFVVAGHNEHIAWGFTALYGDTQDIYVEKTNAEGEYLGADGAWHPIQHDVQTIKVRGKSDVTVDVESTDHGAVITPLIPGETRTLALDWTIYKPAARGLPLLGIDTAANWADFRQAMQQWWAPTQNVVYADDEGNIGYQTVGLIPLRPNGLAGTPITDITHEWHGFIPFEQLPTMYDPPNGLLATANSRVTPQGYPYPLTLEWGDPYRNERIWKWLGPKTGLTEQDMLTLQTDVYSEVDQEIAQRLAYGIDHADHVGQQLRQAANLLRSWNGVVSVDSAPAAILAAAKQAFYPMLLEPKMGDAWKHYRWGESIYAAERILKNESPAWLPPQYRTWDDFLADLVRQGLVMTAAPRDLSTWRYGDAHRVDVEHPIYGLLPWFKRWTGTGALPQSGDTTTVKQVARTFGPSQRFTIDWGNVDTATENIVMGESGDPLSPYYRDQWPYWYHDRTFALPFTEQAVAAATVHTLHLEP